MSSKRYTEEFTAEAVKQITERGLSVADGAGRLGISIHSLCAWQKQLEKPIASRQAQGREMRIGGAER